MERDFNRGNAMVPEISLMGCNTISGVVDGYSAAATDEEILAIPTLLVPTFHQTCSVKLQTWSFAEPMAWSSKKSNLKIWVCGKWKNYEKEGKSSTYETWKTINQR